MEKQRKRVICWGCATYGQYLIDKIEFAWKNEFEVIGIADRASDEINIKIINNQFKYDYNWMELKFGSVYSLLEVSKLYEEDKIDAVIITVQKMESYNSVRRTLERYNIPIISFNDYWSWLPADKISRKSHTICDGYEDYVVENIKGIVNPFLSIVLLYNDKGEVLEESFNYYKSRLLMENIICQYPITHKYSEEISVDKCCVLTRCWSKENYGHFVEECADKMWAMEEAGFDGKYMLFDSEFARSFMDLLDIDSERIIWIDNKNDKTLYIIRELHCISCVQGRSEKCALVVRRLVEKIMRNMQLESEKLDFYPKRIYIKRIGRRRPLGIEPILKKYQFETIIPEELSLDEQIKYFHAADIVFSPHGANSTNSLYMRKDTHFIETFGRKYIFPYWLHTLALQGVHYHMLVEFGQDGGETRRDDHSDYCLDLSLLELILQDVCEVGEFRK